MFNTNYSVDPSDLMAGEPYDSGLKDQITKAAEADIEFGIGVVQSDDDNKCRPPINNNQTIVFSGDLVTSNTINGTINGEAIAQVTFASAHLATMEAIAAAIEDLDPAYTAVVGGANNRTITVTSSGLVPIVAASFIVAAGSSQATVTIADVVIETFIGIARLDHTREQSYLVTGSGGSKYSEGDAVGVARKGRFHVKIEEDIALGDAVYMRVKDATGKTRGAFRNDADSGAAILVSGVKWHKAGTSAKGTAVLELNI